MCDVFVVLNFFLNVLHKRVVNGLIFLHVIVKCTLPSSGRRVGRLHQYLLLSSGEVWLNILIIMMTDCERNEKSKKFRFIHFLIENGWYKF